MDKLNTMDMEIALAFHFNIRRNLIVPNVSWGWLNHEADLIMLSAAGYATEIEIKVSRADLLADKNKDHGHYSKKIKYLYFAIPEHIDTEFALTNIPKRAGLLQVYRGFPSIKIKRQAEKNKSAEKICIEDMYQLARLGTMRIFPLKEIIRDRCKELKKLKEKILII